MLLATTKSYLLLHWCLLCNLTFSSSDALLQSLFVFPLSLWCSLDSRRDPCGSWKSLCRPDLSLVGCLQWCAVCGLCDFAKGTVGLCVKDSQKVYYYYHFACGLRDIWFLKMLLCYYMHGQCMGTHVCFGPVNIAFNWHKVENLLVLLVINVLYQRGLSKII